jgi:Fe-S oxidoreductase/nitrate reductase gamma subunit
VDPAQVPTREIFWNVDGGWLVYPLTAVVLAVLALGLREPYARWRRGRPEAPPAPLAARLRSLLLYALGQARVVRDPFAGVCHVALYSGFLVLFLGTLMIAVQEDLRVPFLRGDFYLFYSLFLDLFGLVALVGLAGLAWRRYVLRPAQLDSGWDDALALALLAAILVGGYVLEGLRIAATELGPHPDWARWSPVGAAVAHGVLALGAPPDALRAWHKIAWWSHALLAFAWMGLLGWTKMRHVLLAPTRAALGSPRPLGVLRPITDFKDAAQLGVGRLADLSARQRLSADTCIHAGRCQAACPAYASGKPLNPKALIVGLQELGRAAGRDPALADAPLTERVLSEAGVWACTACGACSYHCPVLVEPLDVIMEMRRDLVLRQNRLPESALPALMSLQRRGHPWVGTRLSRTDWAEGLGVPTLDEAPDAEVLLWVGCTNALVERNVRVTRAVAQLLQRAGVRFAILGPDETCTGDPARRLGNELLFQQLARKNIATFERYGVRRILTLCPHCFNTLSREYPALGGHYEVLHHAAYLADLVRAGRLPLPGAVARTVTYHDPCFLGRYHGIYDPPRMALDAVPGLRRVEMGRCREHSFCCGAGGGHAFLEERGGERINRLRTREAVGTGAEVIAAACPFCLQMFEEGLGAESAGRPMAALDVAEVLWQAAKAADGAPG